jgi:hypothetical protein
VHIFRHPCSDERTRSDSSRNGSLSLPRSCISQRTDQPGLVEKSSSCGWCSINSSTCSPLLFPLNMPSIPNGVYGISRRGGEYLTLPDNGVGEPVIILPSSGSEDDQVVSPDLRILAPRCSLLSQFHYRSGLSKGGPTAASH